MKIDAAPRRLGLAAMLALSLLAVPAIPATAAATSGSFVTQCDFSHRLPDDPIVFPGQPGASHSHDFTGNRSTNEIGRAHV